MFGYKRSKSVFASKVGSWLITLWQFFLCTQISWETVKNAKNLDLSPSTIHTIVKRFRESRGISVCVWQGRKPLVNVHDLWALKWHCIRNSYAAVLNITKWAQECFRKPLSLNIVCCCIKKNQLYSLLLSEKAMHQLYALMPPDSLGQSSSHIVKKTSSHFKLFLGKMASNKDLRPCPLRTEISPVSLKLLMMLSTVDDEICKAFAIWRWGMLFLKYSTIFLRTLSQIGEPLPIFTSERLYFSKQWFSNLSWGPSITAYFVCLSHLTHLIKLISSLVESARLELGVGYEGDI